MPQSKLPPVADSLAHDFNEREKKEEKVSTLFFFLSFTPFIVTFAVYRWQLEPSQLPRVRF